MALPGYKSYTRNRKGKSHGGIVTSSLSSETNECLKISEGDETNEYIVTRHSQFVIPINVINVYFEQENRSPASVIRDHWKEILEEIIKIEVKGEHVILLGDFNRHIGNIIRGNSEKVSEGGKLILDFLNSGEYVLVNGMSDRVTGGPFIRLEPSDPENNSKKSCIDFVIVSRELSKYVESVKIDDKRTMTQCHAMNKKKLVYPDNLAILTTFKNIPVKKERNKSTPKVKIWNLNKEGGWSMYKSLTENNVRLSNIVSLEENSGDPDPDKIMKKIDKEMTKAKFDSFGKVKYSDKNKSSQKLSNQQKERFQCKNDVEIANINDEIAFELEKVRKENLKQEFNKLKEIKNKKGNIAAIFNLRETLVGKKKVTGINLSNKPTDQKRGRHCEGNQRS